jgi:hypothetical protein
VQLPVLELPTTDLKAGIYYLNVRTEYGSVKREFIIE